jgi:hypothetical protein
MRSRSTVLTLLATLAIPATTYAQPPALTPTQSEQLERESTSPFDQPLFIAGALTFATSYGLAVGAAASSLDHDDRGLYFPVVGPWAALAANHPCDGGCAEDTRDDVLLVLDGVAQAAGVALMATSLIRERERARVHDAHLVITSRSVGVAARF